MLHAMLDPNRENFLSLCGVNRQEQERSGELKWTSECYGKNDSVQNIRFDCRASYFVYSPSPDKVKLLPAIP